MYGMAVEGKHDMYNREEHKFEASKG